MMKIIVLVSALALALAHDYADIDTKFNFEPLMTDKPALRKQVDCYLDRAPCDELTQHYKRHIREEIIDTCKECSDKLKHNIRTFLKELSAVFPEDYSAFRAKYDPDGSKFDLIESAVQKF